MRDHDREGERDGDATDVGDAEADMADVALKPRVGDRDGDSASDMVADGSTCTTETTAEHVAVIGPLPAATDAALSARVAVSVIVSPLGQLV